MDNEINPSELYNLRTLVFMEIEPQSNVYRQVLFSPEDYQRVTRAIGEEVDREGSTATVKVIGSDETYPLPDLKDIYYNL